MVAHSDTSDSEVRQAGAARPAPPDCSRALFWLSPGPFWLSPRLAACDSGSRGPLVRPLLPYLLVKETLKPKSHVHSPSCMKQSGLHSLLFSPLSPSPRADQ
eukprot:1152599-Pelagomonas_calceolata.AAC.2